MKAIEIDDWDYALISECIEVGRRFIEESNYGLTFDRDKIYERLSTAFFNPCGGIVIVKDGGKVMGGAVLYAVADYQQERLGYIEKFFVVPEMRGLGAGRVLAEKISNWFDEKGCVYSFVTGTANIGATGHFENLMAKYGYRAIGPTLSREFCNGKIRS